MADGGSTQVFRQLFSVVRYDIGSASNAISAQIFKTLPAIDSTKWTIITKIYLADQGI
jgi:hypothetical protein